MNEMEPLDVWASPILKPLPFRMRTETPMEKYRAETFWTKEPETIAWIDSFDPGDIFFDIGANVGVYSMYAASRYPEMIIWAFEPMPSNYDALDKNIVMNRFYNITAYRQAVGSTDGWSDLVVPDFEAGKTGAQLIEPSCLVKNRVRVTTIDSLEPLFPDHIKIDIDGQELKVILGMRRTLPRIKSILVEVSKESRGPVVRILAAAGFGTVNRFNAMTPHSRLRRAAEGIDAENIIFMR